MISIVTDSASSIPEDLLTQLQIGVVPLDIIWDGKPYADGVDITHDEFYKRMQGAYQLPTTSAPTPKKFQRAFLEAARNDTPILGIHVGSQFSQTFHAAELAKEMLPEAEIHLVDSKSNSMGLGFQVLAAARAVKDGMDLNNVLQVLHRARANSGIVFTVKDINYLIRGGRFGYPTRMISKLLGQLSIFEIHQEPINLVGRAPSQREAFAKMIDKLEERTRGSKPLRLAVGYTDNLASAEILSDYLAADLKPDELLLFQIPQAAGAHVGPGALGIAYCWGV